MKDEKLEILKAVHSWNGLSKSDIADKVETSRQNIGQNHIPDLEQKGCVKVNDNVWPHEVTITDHGKDILIENEGGTTRPTSVYNESKSNHRFIHRFVVGFPVQNAFALNSDWRERVIEEVNKEVNYVEDFDEYRFEVDKWQFRISGEFVYVRLREEIRGLHYRQVKDNAIDKAIEGARFFEDLDYIPINLCKSPASFRIAEQHIGSSGDNLIHAFVKYVDEETEHNVSNWRVYGEEGSDDRELLIWADKSSGELHEESGNGGNPSGSRGRAEDVQAFTEEITEGMVSRANETRELVYNGVERINHVESKVDSLDSRVESVSEVKGKVQSIEKEVETVQNVVGQRLQEIKQVVKHNNRDSGSVTSMLKEMQQTQESLEEKLIDVEERNNAILSQVAHTLNEINEELQQDNNSSFDNPVQKVFMRTWESEEYSRPWFDSGHLKAWRTKDSGKQVCETILNRETIDRLNA